MPAQFHRGRASVVAMVLDRYSADITDAEIEAILAGLTPQAAGTR